MAKLSIVRNIPILSHVESVIKIILVIILIIVVIILELLLTTFGRKIFFVRKQ